MIPLLAALIFALSAGPALPDAAALLLGNERYGTLDPVPGAGGLDAAADSLAVRGVETVVGSNADRATTLDRIRAFSQPGRNAETQAVLLAGRFAVQGRAAFFLPVEAEGTDIIDGLATGVSVSAIAQLLARTPGRGILILGIAGDGDGDGEEGQPAFPVVDLPQGVTLVTTDPARAVSLVRGVLADPGRPLADIAGDDVRVFGFRQPGWSFLPADREPSAGGERAETGAGATDTGPHASATGGDTEDGYWRLTRRRDDAAAYRAYLERYPQGRYVQSARSRLASLAETPSARAARAEDALDLSRQARRAIQRDLTLLGHDTRGIDGIFGPGTRAAIRAWQTGAGLVGSGYLSAEQVARLDRDGARRAAERDAETRAADERLWSGMGRQRSVAELTDYLDRFGDGIHADDARRRLDRIAPIDGRGDAAERRAWRKARRKHTAAGYHAYLNAYPRGQFVREARAALETVASDRGGAAAEQALRLTPETRRAVEERLAARQFDPGPVDGRFDAETRRAIRRYQQAAGLSDTGYVNQPTAIRLLTDTLSDFLR